MGSDASWLRFCYKGTKELMLPVLSQEMSIPAKARSKVCTAIAIIDYLTHTKDFLHDNMCGALSALARVPSVAVTRRATLFVVGCAWS